jgi:hemolysin activation/secretion protein
LTFSQIQRIAETITNFYQDQGYFLAQAIIPKQDVDNGVIELIIQEGTLDESEPLIINDTGSVGYPLRLKQSFN